VVAVDPSRNLIFVEGSVPGAREGLVTVGHARRPALKDYAPPVIPPAGDVTVEEPAVEEAPTEEASTEEAATEEAPTAEVAEEAPAAEAEATGEAGSAEAADEAAAGDEEQGEAQA